MPLRQFDAMILMPKLEIRYMSVDNNLKLLDWVEKPIVLQN